MEALGFFPPLQLPQEERPFGSVTLSWFVLLDSGNIKMTFVHNYTIEKLSRIFFSIDEVLLFVTIFTFWVVKELVLLT